MNHLAKQLSTLSVRGSAFPCPRKISVFNSFVYASPMVSNKATNLISKGFIRQLSFNSFNSLSTTRWTDSLIPGNAYYSSPYDKHKNTSITDNFAVQMRFRSNRSRRGLYDGKDIKSGNRVTFSAKKIKRKFKPNVFKKRLYSEMLDTMIRFHVTTSALRSIEKAGGLDNYLLKSKHVEEGEGQKIKKILMGRLKMLEFNKREFPQDVAEGSRKVN